MEPRKDLKRKMEQSGMNVVYGKVKITLPQIFNTDGTLTPPGKNIQARLSPIQIKAFNFIKEMYLLYLQQEKCNQLNSDDPERAKIENEIQKGLENIIYRYKLGPGQSTDLNISLTQSNLCNLRDEESGNKLDINNFAEAFGCVFSDYSYPKNLSRQYEKDKDIIIASLSASHQEQLLIEQERKEDPEKGKQRAIGEQHLTQLTEQIEELKKLQLKISEQSIASHTSEQKSKAAQPESKLGQIFSRRRLSLPRIIKKPQENPAPAPAPTPDNLLFHVTETIACLESTKFELNKSLKESLGNKKTTAEELGSAIEKSMNDCSVRYKEMTKEENTAKLQHKVAPKECGNFKALLKQVAKILPGGKEPEEVMERSSRSSLSRSSS